LFLSGYDLFDEIKQEEEFYKYANKPSCPHCTASPK
jgi:hypothetical protein